MTTQASDYDSYAAELASYTAAREQGGVANDGLLRQLLDLLGDVTPYGAVIRRNVADYFDSGATAPYRGLWAMGIKTYLRHRTMEEYLDGFLGAGLRLMKLADSVANCFQPGPDSILPEGSRFPRFMLLRFAKP